MPSSDNATPSPRGALSKLRRNQRRDENNDSTNSLTNSSTSEDPDARNAPSPSRLDAALSRIGSRSRRNSVNNRRNSADTGRRLSALVPGRRNKLKRNPSDLSRNASIDSNASFDLSGNQSDASLGGKGSGAGSLLTDDNSEHEGKPQRPSLSPHPSHLGYLTLSSPEINPQTKPAAAESAHSQSTSSIPHIVESIKHADAPASPARNSLPAETLRGAFSFPPKESEGDKRSAQATPGAAQSSRAVSTPGQSEVLAGQESDVLDAVQSETILKQNGGPTISTTSLPQTPLHLINDTPTTLVTPPTPTDPHSDAPTFARRSPKKPSFAESLAHRRSQSATIPSKLSQSIPAPLTPTVEEARTPGGSLTQPANATGFFSSVFTAARTAADQLSNTLNTSVGANQRAKPGTIKLGSSADNNEILTGAESRRVFGEGEVKKTAVDTLGRGELSFSHLGLSDSPQLTPMTSATELPLQDGETLLNGDANKKTEQEAAARAVSAAYEKPVQNVVAQATGGRPLSVASNDRLTLADRDHTPPRATEPEGIARSGSVRSKISTRKGRHRDSAATTGTANSFGTSIAAGLSATAAGLGHPTANGQGHRLTGFAVASSKRNKDFHQLFRSVPEDDYLIEDYSAALQRDILLHGRLYVSEGHICFSSNILGWVTNLVISFDEVISVEKKSTAVIFPNAIVISTLHARNTFASFVARDSTYELLIGIWKISHPNLKSSLNGVTLDDAGTGDKTEVADPDGSATADDSGSDDEVYDEDADDDVGSFEDAGVAPSVAGSDLGEAVMNRKISTAPVTLGGVQANGAAIKGPESLDAVAVAAAADADIQGALAHEPTQCSESTEHYDRPLTDTTIPAPLGKIYSLMWGPASGAFMRKWLIEDQKSRELTLADDKTGLDNDHKTVTFEYIKPLSGSIGPKQTKCITTNTLVAFDLDKAVSVDCSTMTPDVPSGNVFTTKTRYCLMWGPGNSTRVVANCTIAWTGKSWLKGPIEKGAGEGQTEYCNALVAALRAAVTTRVPVKGSIMRKGKRKGKKGESLDNEAATSVGEATVATKQNTAHWGLLEPVRPLAEPFVSLLKPFMSSQVAISVLLALLLYSWIYPSPARSGRTSLGMPGHSSPERLAAYDEMWRREESNLWEWLEDRVGLDASYSGKNGVPRAEGQKVLRERSSPKAERLSQPEMDDAIRVTEEKLEALKAAIARQNAGNGKGKA